MNREHMIARAESLFIRDGKEIEEIAKILNVSKSTLYRLAKERDWRRRRLEYESSTMAISEKLMKLLSEDVKNLDKLDSSSVDKIVKVVKSIKTLDRDVDMLGATVRVVDELVNFLRERFPGKFDDILKVLPEFMNYMREKYRTTVE